MTIITWLQQFIPAPAGYEWLQYVTAYALLFCMALLILSLFCGIFAAIFRR